MSEPQPREPFGCLAWSVIGIGVVLGVALLLPLMGIVSKVGEQIKAVSNCRQIILSIKQYAAKHQSEHPDSFIMEGTGVRRTSNAAFRKLIEEKVVMEERIFGCPKSPYVPDSNIGIAPSFSEALKPGECHWMMVAGLNDDSAGNLPLVFENTLRVEWPLRWMVEKPGEAVRGRVWKGREIIVGRQDGGAEVYDLRADGTAIFTNLDDSKPLPVLDIEE
ncbi:MAG: hypothetical protein JNG86_15450 [Verrucomicrobiaceae bacterium]|nr:hypothetical protein [Verrucomicrobiaceae bacterium]